MANVIGTDNDDLILVGSSSPGVIGVATDESDNIEGNGGNDTIEGGGGSDILNGGEGNDVIEGGEGGDALSGGEGDDTLNGGAGSDDFVADRGSDEINGGEGSFDTYRPFSNGQYNEFATGGLTLSIDLNTGESTIEVETESGPEIDVLTSIERIQNGTRIEGTNFDDAITVVGRNGTIGSTIYLGFGGNDLINVPNSGASNLIDGGEGDDTLNGGAASDQIRVGPGNDEINGGEDRDSYDFSGAIPSRYRSFATGGLTLNYDENTGSGTITVEVGSEIETDVLTSIEILSSIEGTNFDDTFTVIGSTGFSFSSLDGNDLINAGDGGDEIRGGNGNDLINAAGGNDEIDDGPGDDTLNGGAGDDILRAGSGNDEINGGEGDDEYDLVSNTGQYSRFATGGLVFEYDNNTASGTITVEADSGIETDVLTSIEGFVNRDNVGDIRGTNFDDTFTVVGPAGFEFAGLGGDDLISAGSGNDAIEGGDGDDTLAGADFDSPTPGLGEQDTLEGGAGADRYVLGDAGSVGYDDNDPASDGTNDFAQILDFTSGEDVIQLRGPQQNYRLEVVDGDTQLFFIEASGGSDELVGIIEGVTGLNLGTDDFDFVEPVTVNTPPTAVDDVVATDEDVAVTIDAIANDSDADGDTLSIVSTTQGTDGSVAIDPAGTLTYTPDADFFGDDSFSYTISDGEFSDTATVSVTVNPVNDAPEAIDDGATTNEDEAITINVLANDVDVDGDALVVDSVTQGADGSITLDPDGTVTYTPNADFSGEDSFTYTVSDGDLTDTATVRVEVIANETPDGLTVNSLDDSDDGDPDNGVTTLREAINLANDSAGQDTITFDLPDESTIALASELRVTDDLTVDGSDVPGLTISGADFDLVDIVSANFSATNLVLAGGRNALDLRDFGGQGATLNLTEVTIRDSLDRGINVLAAADAQVSLDDVAISGVGDDGIRILGSNGIRLSLDNDTTISQVGGNGIDVRGSDNARLSLVDSIVADSVGDNIALLRSDGALLSLDNSAAIDASRDGVRVRSSDSLVVSIVNASTIAGSGFDGIDVARGSVEVTIDGSNVAGNTFEDINLNRATAATATIDGTDDADVLVGSDVDDEIAGGAGADTFVFDFRPGNDTIADFTLGEDLLDVSALRITAGRFDRAIEASGETIAFNVAGGGSVTLVGVDATALSASDFILA